MLFVCNNYYGGNFKGAHVLEKVAFLLIIQSCFDQLFVTSAPSQQRRFDVAYKEFSKLSEVENFLDNYELLRKLERNSSELFRELLGTSHETLRKLLGKASAILRNFLGNS